MRDGQCSVTTDTKYRKDATAKENTMSFEFIKKLPTPDQIRQEHPLPERFARAKQERDAEIRDVITGRSNKFLVIIGPCSAGKPLTYSLRVMGAH